MQMMMTVELEEQEQGINEEFIVITNDKIYAEY